MSETELLELCENLKNKIVELKNKDQDLKAHFKQLKEYCDGLEEEEAANNFIKSIRQMNKEMGIPEKLQGIKKEDIKIMAKHAAKEANPLYPVPKLMNAKQFEQFYYDVIEEN